jgi:hypothetical protein
MMCGQHLRPCGMRLRTGDPTLLDDLRAHFERSGFGDLDVRRPDAPSPEQEALEIELHLKVWRVMRPGIRVELVDR